MNPPPTPPKKSLPQNKFKRPFRRHPKSNHLRIRWPFSNKKQPKILTGYISFQGGGVTRISPKKTNHCAPSTPISAVVATEDTLFACVMGGARFWLVEADAAPGIYFGRKKRGFFGSKIFQRIHTIVGPRSYKMGSWGHCTSINGLKKIGNWGMSLFCCNWSPREHFELPKIGGWGLMTFPFQLEPRKKKKTYYFPWNTGWFIGILIMVYYNPYIIYLGIISSPL